jgi:peptide/nickel transport system ATP-binding protein
VRPTEDIVHDPLHPYTRALVAAVPEPHPDQSHAALPIGPGAPDARNPPSGCRFRDRCPHAFERCAVEAPKPIRAGTRRVECHLFDGRPPRRARGAAGQSMSSTNSACQRPAWRPATIQ